MPRTAREPRAPCWAWPVRRARHRQRPGRPAQGTSGAYASQQRRWRARWLLDADVVEGDVVAGHRHPLILDHPQLVGPTSFEAASKLGDEVRRKGTVEAHANRECGRGHAVDHGEDPTGAVHAIQPTPLARNPEFLWGPAR